jgi:hypothetical protein
MADHPQDNQNPVSPQDGQPVNPVNQPVNNVPIAQAQVVQGTDGGIALKVQRTKLPEFGGQKEKDSIGTNAFVKRINKIMSANNWSDNVNKINIAEMHRYIAARDEALGQFYLLNQFRAALPMDLHQVINLRPMEMLNLFTVVGLATIEACSKEEAKAVSRVQDVQAEDEDDCMEAITQGSNF